MPDPRTTPAMRALAEAIESDTAEIVALLEDARARMLALADVTGALNGMAPLLRGAANETELTASKVREEATELAAKLVPSPKRPAMTVHGPDPERVRAITEAREAV
jgi:hypothetical protein